MDPVFLSTLAVQFGSAIFNSFRGSKHSKELAAKQQALEEKIAREGIENARQEFAEMCELQREMERQMQRDRIQLIKDNHKRVLLEEAYSLSLENWSLLVPPVVIKNQSLYELGDYDDKALPLNCILTTSADNSFNRQIFPALEESLAEFCAKYWNIASNKGILFYQNAWRDNNKDIGSVHRNLYTHLSDVPTLVLSPRIKEGKLRFRMYYWGISLNPTDTNIDEKQDFVIDLPVNVQEGKNYTSEDIKTIAISTSEQLKAFISYFADLYYWNFYHIAPTLPILIANGLEVNGADIEGYANGYLRALSEHSQRDHIIETVDCLESLSEISSPKNFEQFAVEQLKNELQTPALRIDEINRVNDFAKSFNLQPIQKEISKFTTEEVEVFDILDDFDLSFESIANFSDENIDNAFEADYFVYLEWSPNVIIAGFSNAEFEPSIFLESNQTRFFVLVGPQGNIDEEPYRNLKINIIEYNETSMRKNHDKESLRERFGQRLINIGTRLKGVEEGQSSSSNSPWDSEHSQTQRNDLDIIISYFIQGVNRQEIPYTKVGHSMAMSDVLNWLDSLSDDDVLGYNQVYVVKGHKEQENKVLYCVFLAKNDKFRLEMSEKLCFICDSESEEMKGLFAGKLIYVIPFED